MHGGIFEKEDDSMHDTNGKEIKAGDTLRHTGHGGLCKVCESTLR